MLELWTADGALGRIEDELRAAGFFEPDARRRTGSGRDATPSAASGLCADVYLGYGLSQTLRRTTTPTAAGAVPIAAGRGPHPTGGGGAPRRPDPSPSVTGS